MQSLQVRLIDVFRGHSGSIYRMIRGNTPGSFITAGGDGLIVEWNIHQPDRATVKARVPGTVFSLWYNPEAEILIAGQMAGGIHILDLNRKQEIKLLQGHQKPIFSLKEVAGRIIAGGGDGAISIWDANSFKHVATYQISDERIRSIDYNPSGQELAIGCSDHFIYILDARTFEVKQRLSGHQNSVFATRFISNCGLLLSGSRDAHLSIWEINKGWSLKQRIPAHMFTINDIELNPSKHLIATASRDKTVKIWDADTFELKKVIDREKFDSHTHSVNTVLWLSDNMLVSAGDDRSVRIWEVTA